MKELKLLHDYYGTNEFGFPDFPIKVSGTMIRRIKLINKGYCPYCFPHGYETPNNRYSKRQKSWKKHRKTQYKP